MSTFDIEEAQSLLDSRNFYGYADYLRKHKAKNPRSQEIINSKIEEYTRLGDIQQSILDNCENDDERDAYNFMSGMSGIGRIPDDKTGNSYAIKYKLAINSLRTKDGKDIHNLSIRYKDENEFNKFCNNLNTTKEELYNKYKITFNNNSDDGSIDVIIGTDNKMLPEILNNRPTRNYGPTHRPSVEALESEPIVYKGHTYYGHNTKATKHAIDNYVSTHPLYNNNNKASVQAIDDSGNTVDERGYDYETLDAAVNYYNRAKRIADSIMKKQKSENFEEQLYVSEFLGEGHKKAYEDWKAGKIKTSEYESIVKARTESYNRKVQLTDLTAFQMYSYKYEEGAATHLTNVEAKDKAKMNALISRAIDENRVTYGSGDLNGELGTVIVIHQSKDEKDKMTNKDVYAQTRIFIPGLFTKSAQKVFDSNTKGKAVKTNADMKRWNYAKTMHDGTRIGYDKSIGAYTIQENEYGQNVKVRISEADVLHKLNEEYIIKSSVDSIYGLFDENNNLKPLPSGKTPDIQTLAKAMATKGVEDLYPGYEYDSTEKVYERDVIMRKIINLLYNRLNVE